VQQLIPVIRIPRALWCCCCRSDKPKKTSYFFSSLISKSFIIIIIIIIFFFFFSFPSHLLFQSKQFLVGSEVKLVYFKSKKYKFKPSCIGCFWRFAQAYIDKMPQISYTKAKLALFPNIPSNNFFQRDCFSLRKSDF
jgi:hypothetical protein